MIRLAFLAIIVASLLGGGTTSAAPAAVSKPLVGTWTSDFNSITIKKSGQVLFRLGSEVIYEKLSTTPTRATFSPAAACPGKGVYSWKVTGRTLTFTRVADACVIRRTFLKTTWTRK